MSLFCYALLCVHSSIAITLKRTRKLVALLLLSYRCSVYSYYKCSVALPHSLWLFVVFPDHTHFFILIQTILSYDAFPVFREKNNLKIAYKQCHR